MIYPETIEVSDVKRIESHANIILLPSEFYKFINIEGFKTVFFKNRELFVFKDGVYIGTPILNNYKTYEELAIKIESLLEKGFKTPIEILEGYLFDLEDYNLYLEFKESSFKRSVSLSGNLRNINRSDFSREYELFLEAKKFGSTERSIFQEAKNVGIPTFEEYTKFKESDFYYGTPSNFNRNKNTYIEKYREFVGASKGGFISRDQYLEAKMKGFSNKEIYDKFIKSGCKTKQEYENYLPYIEDLPKILEPMGEDILHTLREADEFYNSKKYGEFYKKRYLIIENISKRACEEILQKRPKNTVIEEILNELELTTKTKIVNKDKMKKYRELRNDVTHELKNPITREIADNARTFFDELYTNLKVTLEKN